MSMEREASVKEKCFKGKKRRESHIFHLDLKESQRIRSDSPRHQKKAAPHQKSSTAYQRDKVTVVFKSHAGSQTQSEPIDLKEKIMQACAGVTCKKYEWKTNNMNPMQV